MPSCKPLTRLVDVTATESLKAVCSTGRRSLRDGTSTEPQTASDGYRSSRPRDDCPPTSFDVIFQQVIGVFPDAVIVEG